MARHSQTIVAACGLAVLVALSQAAAQPRKPVQSVDDLPRFSYRISGSVADVLTAPRAAFVAETKPIRADLDRLLADYDITDQATLRTLLAARLALQIATGAEDPEALQTIAAIRGHQDKPAERLTADLTEQAFLEARLAGHEAAGVCPARFGAIYARHLDPLPWDVTGIEQIWRRGFAQVATAAFVIGETAADIQPTLDRAHALSNAAAWHLVTARAAMDVVLPCRQQIVAALTAYIRRHDRRKPDIWTARAVTLRPSSKLTPVNVAIWDSGVDETLFGGALLTDARGVAVRGPAYDVLYQPTTGALAPLSREQQAGYQAFTSTLQGVSDLQSGIDSPAATALRERLGKMSPAQAQAFFTQVNALAAYSHGTHVAGIAAAGNPAIRLTSMRVTYDTKPMPTPASEALMARMAGSYGTSVAWFRAHGIRVVNMSWWDRPSNYEDQLEKNGIGKDAEERKRLARHYFTIERDALYAALKSAPDILFVTIAGNNNSDNAFEETIPSSFKLPNLIVVGAVDQGGGRTSFTSTGQNIGVYADGYQVESVVPGGARVRLSGTSMAAPAVTNLAATLLAVDPALTPTQLIAVMERNADPGAGDDIKLLNPRRSLADVQDRAGKGQQQIR
jgi:subtilisin family serine protease